MYNSLGASIIDDGRLDFDAYVKKACPMMLVDDSPEKKATTSKFDSLVVIVQHFQGWVHNCWESMYVYTYSAKQMLFHGGFSQKQHGNDTISLQKFSRFLVFCIFSTD